MKIFKKMDLVIIFFLVVLSFIPNFIFAKKLNKNYNSTYASIKVSGKLYDNISLSSYKGEKTFTIKTKNGNNVILVKDNTIQVISSDCLDSICIKQGVSSKVNDSIICLPHELIIEIKGRESDSSSDMILSH